MLKFINGNMILNYKDLGSRVFLALELGEESERKFFSLPPPGQRKVLCMLTEYISRMKNEKLSTSEAYDSVQEICTFMETGHPFDLCTKKKFEKYLGYHHVFVLVYSWSFEMITLSLKRFSAEFVKRQKKIFSYRDKLLQLFISFSAEQKVAFWEQKKLMEKQLSEKQYSDLKATIIAFEEEYIYVLPESLYASVESADGKDTIKGIFNAVVTTYSQIG
ncbi:MAG: hypothetical protein LBD11_01925 [Candidatus Peribacteria bacterium]|jgi:hypothetical protein|nr:hypothetical protein [Candidatus Peribacteria bacterium]